jgi:hypothetical protein
LNKSEIRNKKEKMNKVNLKYWMMSVTVGGFLASCTPQAENTGDHAEEATEEHAHGDHDGHDHGAAPEGIVIQEITEGQKVFFANLKDGQSVTSPLTVEFGVEGMVVEPAGEIKKNSGHHHLLIDHDFSPAGTVVPPADSTQLHFGKGQLSTQINLAPGKHKLTMQFANGAHMSYGEKMSTSITVSVEAAAKHMGDKK